MAALKIIDFNALKRFFQVYSNLDYLDQYIRTAQELVAGNRQHLTRAYIMAVIFILEISRFLVQWLKPPKDHYWQVVLFDFPDILKMSPVLKLLYVLILITSAYMLFILHFRVVKTLAIFEISKLIRQPEKSVIYARYGWIVRQAVLAMNMFQFFTFINAIWILATPVMFALELMPYLHLQQWPLGCVTIFIFTATYLLSQSATILYSYTYRLGFVMSILINLVLFEQFSVVDRMLHRGGSRRDRLRRVQRFIGHHTLLLRIVFDLNIVYGHLLLVFMVLNLPINMTLVGMIILNMVTPLVYAIFLVVCFGYIIVFVGLHWMTALYTRKIHQPYRRVVSVFVRITTCSLQVRWRIASRIEAFVTRKPYGITYGSFGLINMATFGRFMLVYGKFILITYKIMAKLKSK